MQMLFILFGIAFALSLIPFGWLVLRGYRRYRGTRVVTCPETRKTVAVEVDAAHAAVTDLAGAPDLRLKSCSRWPERQDCGQECLAELEAAPDGCLVRNLLTDWYRGKTCALCGRAFEETSWSEHKPAVLSPQRATLEWDDVAPESLPGILSTHLPICWNCHMAESFRRLHPELGLEDPLHKEARRSAVS